jgi:TPR repeat protein
MSHRSPARRAAHGHLPNLSGSPAQAVSPYRKAAAKQSQLRGSWKSVALPDIPGMSGPAGPADGPLSPDPMFQAKESKALSTWMQAAQNGDAEAQNNLGVSYYRGINGVQKVGLGSASAACVIVAPHTGC